jgi:hypothetical protein
MTKPKTNSTQHESTALPSGYLTSVGVHGSQNNFHGPNLAIESYD